MGYRHPLAGEGVVALYGGEMGQAVVATWGAREQRGREERGRKERVTVQVIAVV